VHRRAYTLIEVLVVVIIVGLIAGLGVPAVVHQIGSTPLERTLLLLRTADHQARALAVAAVVEVVVTPDGMSHRTATGVTPTECEPGVTLVWLSPTGKPVSGFTVDRHGRTQDLVVEIAAGDERHRYAIFGISGEWSRIMPAASPEERP
jgi:prepilin-type N-terminal cleavage/methylation domain-containing protein